MVEPTPGSEEEAVVKGGTWSKEKTEKKSSFLSGLFGQLKKKSTVKVCPKCKTENPPNQNYCTSCGTKLEMQRNPLGELLSFPAYLAAFMGSAFVFLNPVISALPIPGDFSYPLFPGFNISLLWFVVLLVGVYFAWKLMRIGITSGILLTVVMIIGIASLGVGSGFIIGMTMPGGVIEDPTLKTIMCLFNPSSWSQQGMTECQQSVVAPATPEVEKEGSYNAINLKLGSEFATPPYTLPNIQGNRTHIFQYIFPISVENPSEDEVVRDFTIVNTTKWRTVIYNESCNYPTSCPSLIPSQCEHEEDEKCDIEAGGELSITMDSGGDYYDRRSTSLTIKVSTQYSYSNEGKNEFVLARSLQDLSSVPKMKPTTGTGPVDVTVFFSPLNYVSGSKLKTVYLFITLSNKGKGYAYIKNINITQLTGGFLDFIECRLGTERKNTTEISLPGEPQLIKELTYSCKYNITKGVTDVPFQTIPFTVKVGYDYRESKSQEVDIERTE